MAYPLTPGDLVQLTIQYAQQNIVEMLNVLHYRYNGTQVIPDAAPALQRLLEYFNETNPAVGWIDRWQPIASTFTTLDKYHAQIIYPTRYVKHTWDIAVTGAVAVDPLPGLTQWSITKRADRAGRGMVGGLRVPGLPDTMELGSELNAAARPIADALAAYVALTLAPTPGEIWVPVIYHRAQPSLSPDVTQAFAQYTLRTQRTRIAFRGQ